MTDGQSKNLKFFLFSNVMTDKQTNPQTNKQTNIFGRLRTDKGGVEIGSLCEWQ